MRADAECRHRAGFGVLKGFDLAEPEGHWVIHQRTIPVTNNTLAMAFGISADDVASVLEEYRLRIIDARGQSFGQMAEELVGELDHERIAQEALDAGCDMDEQTAAAHAEIKRQLVEQGVLEC
jgi:hypothetical protein